MRNLGNFTVLIMMLFLSFGKTFAGDSSGGGHTSALEFRSAAMIYVSHLKGKSPERLLENGIKISGSALEDAILSKHTEIHILADSDSFVIDESREVVVEQGRIREGQSSKTAYYKQAVDTIFVGIDWKPFHTQLALKEFLRTIDNVDAEEQAVRIDSWYDVSRFASDSSCAVNVIKKARGIEGGFESIEKICMPNGSDRLIVYKFDDIRYKTEPEVWTLDENEQEVPLGQDVSSALNMLFNGLEATYIKGTEEMKVHLKVVTMDQSSAENGGKPFKTTFNTFKVSFKHPKIQHQFTGYIGVDIAGMQQ